jgi:hypothetical protein
VQNIGASLAIKPNQSKTSGKFGAKPLAELIENALQPIMAAQGFASTDIIIGWPEIIGEKLAEFSRPVKIEWPRRRSYGDDGQGGEAATLVLKVESAFALDIQHMLPVLIERVNARYGWRCIGKIVIKQGPVPRPSHAAPRRSLDPAMIEQASQQIGAIEDEGLRDALVRLGAGILSDSHKKDKTA